MSSIAIPAYAIGAEKLGMDTNEAGGSCDHCYEEFPSLSACSNCHKARYCSSACQKAEWKLHRLFCLDRSKLTTADRLALAAYADEIPSDPEVRRDYGFARAQIPRSENWLIGLFQGLVKHGEIDPRTIHQQRLAGTLIDYIKKFYDRMPVGSQGDYYPWFLNNQHLLAPPSFLDTSSAALTDDALQHAWWFIGGSTTDPLGHIKTRLQTWPEDKQQCLRLVQFLLHAGFRLSPNFPEWLNFGFCGYKSRADETKLWAAYVKLVKAAPFEEFYAAYRGASLPALFAAHGMHLTNPLVLDILNSARRDIKSVWKLKQFIIGDYQKLDPQVSVEYGFVNCGDTLDKEAVIHSLKQVYKNIIDDENFDPLKLHEACLQNKLFQYAQRVIQVNAMFAPLMKNVH